MLISLSFDRVKAEMRSLMARYDALPRHIAKKHLKASIGRALKPHVKTLRQATPKGRKRIVRTAFKRNERGQFQKGGGKKKNAAGALRRAATVRTGWKGNNKDGYAFGVLGYKYGTESMKAIFLEYGTSRGIVPRLIVERVSNQVRPTVMKVLRREMASALAAAAKELAKGKNPGWGKG